MKQMLTSNQIISGLADAIKKSDKLTQKFNQYIDLLGEDVVASGITLMYKNVEHPTFRNLQAIFDYYLKLKEVEK